jgi:uncharacterized protein YjbJ (UPF0337 family)
MSESLNLQAPWNEVKERIKENDVNITDGDLQYSPGKEDELLERLSKKMNKPKQKVKEYIESISANTERAG